MNHLIEVHVLSAPPHPFRSCGNKWKWNGFGCCPIINLPHYELILGNRIRFTHTSSQILSYASNLLWWLWLLYFYAIAINWNHPVKRYSMFYHHPKQFIAWCNSFKPWRSFGPFGNWWLDRSAEIILNRPLMCGHLWIIWLKKRDLNE